MIKKLSKLEITDELIWYYTKVKFRKFYDCDFVALPEWMQDMWYDITFDHFNEFNRIIDELNNMRYLNE